LPGFVHSSVSPNVWYKDWTPISVNLSDYAGQTVTIEFITSDCTQGGHFGYAYFDVNSTCDGTISGSALCLGNRTLTLTAPTGFAFYEWFSNSTFSNPIGDGQTLVLDPAPSVSSIIPVIVSPYPSFGCVDTLYATVYSATKPVSDAGPDKATCQRIPVQLGTSSINSLYSYSWIPANFLQDPASAHPTTRTNLPGPVNFIVKTIDN